MIPINFRLTSGRLIISVPTPYRLVPPTDAKNQKADNDVDGFPFHHFRMRITFNEEVKYP